MKTTDLNPERPIPLSEADLSSIIGMAWSDDTPFEAIALQFGLSESDVVALMRDQLKTRSFRVWRMRVRGRSAKHQGQQRGHDQWQTQQGSSSAVQRALSDFNQEEFPSPPSAATRQSLR